MSIRKYFLRHLFPSNLLNQRHFFAEVVPVRVCIGPNIGQSAIPACPRHSAQLPVWWVYTVPSMLSDHRHGETRLVKLHPVVKTHLAPLLAVIPGGTTITTQQNSTQVCIHTYHQFPQSPNLYLPLSQQLPFASVAFSVTRSGLICTACTASLPVSNQGTFFNIGSVYIEQGVNNNRLIQSSVIPAFCVGLVE